MGVRTCFIISNQAGAPHVSIWKSFTEIHHLLIDESFRNLRLALFVRWNFFYVNDRAYRFWAKCVLGNGDIYMLVFPVDGGPIWSIIKVETAELLGEARSVTLVVYQP